LALGRAGRRVAVFEQHSLPGGFCQSFTLGGFRFSPGVHYLGDLQPGGGFRRVLEGLGLSGDLSFFEMNRDGYDHVLGDGKRFDFPTGRQALTQRLVDRFPHEAKGIRAYVSVLDRLRQEPLAMIETERLGDLWSLPRRAPVSARYGLRSAASVIGGFVADPALRALLIAQAGDVGMVARRAPFAVLGSASASYLEGAFYPKGGGAAIVNAFTRALKRAGAEVHLATPVDRILLEGRRAVGVRLAGGREVSASQLVSNADPAVTYGLVGAEHWSRTLRRRLARARWSVSTISLFLAVEADLRELGLDSGNWWVGNCFDDQTWPRLQSDPAGLSPLPLFLSVSTLKDPSLYDGRHHVCEAFTFSTFEPFRRWAVSETGQRPAEYAEAKAGWAKRMLGTLRSTFPGLASRVALAEVATPLTHQHYTRATRGAVYGMEKSLGQLGPLGFTSRSEFEALRLCGASTSAMGIIPSMLSGLRAAAGHLDCRIADLLSDGGTPLSIASAEDASGWDGALTAQVQRRRQRA